MTYETHELNERDAWLVATRRKSSWTKPVLLEVDSYISQSGERLYKYMYNDTSIVLSGASHRRPTGQSKKYYINNPSKFFQAKLGVANDITSWPLEVQQEFIQQYWQRCLNINKHLGKAQKKEKSTCQE